MIPYATMPLLALCIIEPFELQLWEPQENMQQTIMWAIEHKKFYCFLPLLENSFPKQT